VRRIFVELGKRLHVNGALPSPRDIFNLNIDEILGFCNGTMTDLHDIARTRRAEFASYRSEAPPPDRFETRGAPGLYEEFEATKATSFETPEGDFVRGIGCCAGLVRGRARVVRNPRGVTLQAGEILVAQQTDPGWVMLFPAAAGVLVERGSLLSHSAIVSREMRIPSVVSIRGLMDWVEDGELLELDGKEGTVRKVSANE
jgi:pyruvate,water dikinase